MMLDDADPLADPLARASLAIMRLADPPDDRYCAEPIWSDVERAIRVLAEVVDLGASQVPH